MKKLIIYTLSIVTAMLSLSSCKDTWLMYDVNQKSELYFTETRPTFVSFSIINEEETAVEIPVNVMGKITEADRSFEVECVPSAQGETIESGGTTFEVYTPADNEYSFDQLVIPANQPTGTLKVTIKKTEMMKDKFAKLQIRLKENEEFLPIKADSTDMNKFITPDFTIYVNAGEPTCPAWWSADAKYPEWHMYIGKFYPSKYRRMLELYWSIEQKNPTFFEFCLDKYGRNLNNKDIEPAFFQSENPAVWATFVLIPLYEEFKTMNKDDYPEDQRPADFIQENFPERFGPSGDYWRNPVALYR